MPNDQETKPNVFNSVALLLKGLADGLEGTTEHAPLPRWVRIARGRPGPELTPLDAVMPPAVRALVTGVEKLEELAFKAEALLLKGDAVIALGEVGIEVVEVVSQPEFQSAITEGLGLPGGSLSSLTSLKEPLDKVKDKLDKVPTEADLRVINAQLYRLLCVQHDANGKVNLATTGKIRLLKWSYIDPAKLGDALGARSLTKTPRDAKGEGVFNDGNHPAVTVFSIDFGSASADEAAANKLLTDLGYGTTPNDVKLFQEANGYAEADRTGTLDLRTINSLLNLDIKSQEARPALKKS